MQPHPSETPDQWAQINGAEITFPIGPGTGTVVIDDCWAALLKCIPIALRAIWAAVSYDGWSTSPASACRFSQSFVLILQLLDLSFQCMLLCSQITHSSCRMMRAWGYWAYFSFWPTTILTHPWHESQDEQYVKGQSNYYWLKDWCQCPEESPLPLNQRKWIFCSHSSKTHWLRQLLVALKACCR